MRCCLVTRWPKARPAVRFLAPECWRLRRRWFRRGSYHRLFRFHRNPGCWGRWGPCRARPAPILESRSWRSRTGRLAPRPACSDRLSARRCHATRNLPRAPAPPLPASTLFFPSCGGLYPTAYADDTLTSLGASSVASGDHLHVRQVLLGSIRHGRGSDSHSLKVLCVSPNKYEERVEARRRKRRAEGTGETCFPGSYGGWRNFVRRMRKASPS
jgi:hypothetical protein